MTIVLIGIHGYVALVMIIQGGCFHTLEDTRDHTLQCAFGHGLVDEALGRQVDVVSIGFIYIASSNIDR